MESKVNFRDDQEQQAADHNNLQAFVQRSFDHLVFDAIENNMAFAGLDTAASGTSQVTTQAGELYANGKVSVALDVVVTNLVQYLPAATQKKIALVTWATEADLDVQARDFLINIDTGETQPQAVSMEHRRVANIGAVPGVESPDPQLPTLDSNLLPFCIVTMGTTGIISVEMVDANRLPRLSDVAEEVAELEAWRAQTEPRITTIASDITSLAQQLTDNASDRDLFNLYADVARLKAIAELPADYSAYGADRFLSLDTSDTDTGNVNLLAKVEEGCRFSDANAGLSALQIFNSLDPNAAVANGFLLPAYKSQTRLNITGYSGDLSISQYLSQTVQMQQLSMSRQRIRYGSTYTYCTNSSWWKSGDYDPVTHIFTRNGETFQVLSGDTSKNHQMIRLEQFWVDTYQDPYWKYLVTNNNVTGSMIAQTFLNSQDGWLTQIGFYVTRRAASGNINVVICNTIDGAPDLTSVIMQTTVNYSDIKLYPNQTGVTIPPTFLKAGQRYALVILTTANHWVAMANGLTNQGSSTSGAIVAGADSIVTTTTTFSGNAYSQGTFFYSTDGAFFQGDLTKDLMMTLNFAQFTNPRVVINLQPLQLDGGIAAIDINADCITPGACQLTYEVQIGSQWIALSDVDTQALIGLPPLIPLRAVFVGTSDVMPGLKLLNSQVQVSRPRTTFKHISSDLIRVTTQQVKVEATYENWNPANHSVACSLLVGSDFSTVETPDVTEEKQIDDYSIRRTYTFNLAAATDDYKIVFDGTTTSALDVFHIAERVDVDF